MDNLIQDELNLEVSTVSHPHLQITPSKTFYNQGDKFNIDCDSVTQKDLDLIYEKLLEQPELCAVHTSQYKKIYFKAKT